MDIKNTSQIKLGVNELKSPRENDTYPQDISEEGTMVPYWRDAEEEESMEKNKYLQI